MGLCCLHVQAQPGKSSAQLANKCFDRAVKAYKMHGRHTPWQLWNNWAVLDHRLGIYDKAEKRFDMALMELSVIVAPVCIAMVFVLHVLVACWRPMPVHARLAVTTV